MTKLNQCFWWFLSHVLLIYVINTGDRRRIGINWIMDSAGNAIVVVIPLFPWLSVYHDFESCGFYFGWRIYAIQFRVRRNYKAKWFFTTQHGFHKLGKQSVLMTWEEWEDLREKYPKCSYTRSLSIDQFAVYGIRTWEAGSIPIPSKNNSPFKVERAD